MHQRERRWCTVSLIQRLKKKNASFDFIDGTNEVFSNLSSSLSIDLGIDALVLDKASNGV